MDCLRFASPPALRHAAARRQAFPADVTRPRGGVRFSSQLTSPRPRAKYPSIVASASSSSSSSSSSAVTYSANISTNLPIYEPPWASFDDYLADRQRVFQSLFPDKKRSQRLNDEEWRIQMLPIQFLLVSANPVVDMRLRCKSLGKCYSSGIPHHVSRVLELQAIRWKLEGLDSIHVPQHFDLDVQGTLYSVKRGGQSRLKGHLEISVSLVLPQVFALVPEGIIKSVAESVLKRLGERMKQEVDGSLLADFRDFSREMRSKQEKRASIHSAVS